MKINILCRSLLLLFLIPIGMFAQKKESPHFYYGFNEKIEISKQPDKVILRTATTSTEDQITELFRRVIPSLSFKEVNVLNGMNRDFSITFNQFIDIDELYESLEGKIKLSSLHHCYTTIEGMELFPTNDILLKPLKGASIFELQQLNSKFNARVEVMGRFLKVSVPASMDVITVANQYQESGQVKYAHPDFIANVEKLTTIPNDEYFDKQFALHNTGQVINDGNSGTADADVDAPEAWDITKGDINIVVAVIDEGVTFDHPDLPAARQMVVDGSNFAAPYDGTDENDPSPTLNGNHGNACAGIVAASQDNNIGVTGIAPEVTIMPIRIPFGAIPSSVYVEAVEFAWEEGADVLSNSWGYSSSDPNAIPALVDAFEDAATLGRGGLGAVVAIASGNKANHVNGNSGYITFPGCIDVDGVLTVGASDRYDAQANYSGTSNTASSNNQIIDIVAPSHKAYVCQISTENFEIWTMDIPGSTGYNPHAGGTCMPAAGEQLPSTGADPFAFTGRMGGTSASTPLVAGIAALALSLDNSLTQLAIFDLLTSTADDVGGYSYTNSWCNEIGHGRANAFNAVSNATSCVSDLTLSGTEAGTSTYMVVNAIASTQTIEASANVSYMAGNSISLKPGFHAKDGCDFHAFLGACKTGGTKGNTKNTSTSESLEDYAIQSLSTLRMEQTTASSILLATPNPFHSSTILSFNLDEDTEANLIIYDLNGRLISQLADGHLSKGKHEFIWKADDLPSGIYLAKLIYGNSVQTARIMLAK